MTVTQIVLALMALAVVVIGGRIWCTLRRAGGVRRSGRP